MSGPKEHGVMMTGENVVLILQGRKIETRRTRGLERVNAMPDGWTVVQDPKDPRFWRFSAGAYNERVRCPYGVPGEKLWIRETWRTLERESDCVDGILFRADGAFVEIENTKEAAEKWVVANDNGRHKENWRPAIHMCRWSARLVLEVEKIRVERLQAIDDFGAIAEGAVRIGDHESAWRDGYRLIWEGINGPKSWDRNPYVWVVRFRKIKP